MAADIKNTLIRLLRWSEHYTKTDMVYLVQGGTWMALGTGVTWVCAFATMYAFANWLPKETYGTYQYVLSFMSVLGVLALSGMDTAIARATAQGKDGSLFEALRAKVQWGLIGGAVAMLGGIYYLIQGNEMLGYAFIIIGIFIPFWGAPGIYISYAQGKKRFDITNIYDVGAQLLAAISIVATLQLTDNLLAILLAYLTSWTVARVIFFRLIIKKLPPNNERDPTTISYGKHLTVMSAFNSISVNIDTLLLWQVAGPAAVASYMFARAIPQRTNTLTKAISRLAFPKMATNSMGTMQDTLLYKVVLLCGAATVAAIVYAALAPYLFQLFFPKYIEAVPLTQILALLIALQPLGLFLNPLTSHAKQKLLYIYNFGLPIFRVIVFLLVVPSFGLMGAVIGLVIIKVFDGLFLTWLFYRA